MDIFVLDRDPVVAAQMQCDRHVVKMVLESAQMLSTAVNLLGGDARYKTAHVNHPCSVWARETAGNFLWLYDHGMALAKEYTERYGKRHKSEEVIQDCMYQWEAGWIWSGADPHLVTPHPLCMPDEYKTDDVVQSYRAYYLGDKVRFAQWNKTRPAPQWWAQGGEDVVGRLAWIAADAVSPSPKEGWRDSLILACDDVEEEYDELREILKGIVNNAQYYKHGIWTVTWEQIEKAKKKVEAWDDNRTDH